MVDTQTGTWRQKLVVGLLFSAMLLSGLWQTPASADVTEVEGSAFGYYVDVGLFGGPSMLRGFGQDPGIENAAVSESPSVELPPGGSATPIIDSDPDGATAQYGPAIIFDSTSMEVSTEGTTGPDGSVTSRATAEGVNVPGDYFSADSVESTCTATEEGLSGSVTLSGAQLTLSTDPDTGEAVNVEVPPGNPAPNTEYSGTIDHVGDTFRIILNEQIIDGDTITVNAVHLFLGQNAAGEDVESIARGDAVIGQSVCGVTSDGQSGSTTTEPDGGSTTTEPDGSTTTTEGNGGGSTTTTMGNGGGSTTTTTMGNGGGSTTTTMGNGGGSTTTTMGDGGTTTTTQPDPGDGDCEEPTDFVGQLIFQIFRGISDLLESLGISGFDDFGCDLDD